MAKDIFPSAPKYFRYVDASAEAPSSEISKATPVYIADLPAGEATPHQHSASDITSGTFAVARIPELAEAKIAGLTAKLDDIIARLEVLETA